MDPFTFAWVTLMSLSGLILGFLGLTKGSVTLSVRPAPRATLYQKPTPGFYLLCICFLLSGLTLISVSLYMYV